MSKEIQGYHKGTYYIGDGRREPENFNSLPYYSIVRAIGNHVKQNVITNKLISCLYNFNFSRLLLGKRIYLKKHTLNV